MNENLKFMLNRYPVNSREDQENALLEIVQEIVLLGLANGDFFREAAFYGGTALRLFYGLNRFSEDLDFTALHSHFSGLPKFKKDIEKTLASYDLDFEFVTKKKDHSTKDLTPIESAFLKENTQINLLNVGIKNSGHPDARLKIKIEIDTKPALDFTTEAKLLSMPEPCYVQTLTAPSLFAGKLHALLFRERKINIKGRDWYDLAWYLNRKIKYRLPYLEQKIIQTLKERPENAVDFESVNEDVIKKQLLRRLDQLDLESAKKDVARFLPSKESLRIWSVSYFKQLIENQLVCEREDH